MTTLTRHFEEHSYGLDDGPLITEGAPGKRQYRPYVVVVAIQNSAIWRVVTVGYAIEPQYGPSSVIVREEWSAGALRAERARPLVEFIESQDHYL